jgi:hypothetical protein
MKFSAPSRKTWTHQKQSGRSEQFHAQEAGREARPATPEAGVHPNIGIRVERKKTMVETVGMALKCFSNASCDAGLGQLRKLAR